MCNITSLVLKLALAAIQAKGERTLCGGWANGQQKGEREVWLSWPWICLQVCIVRTRAAFENTSTCLSSRSKATVVGAPAPPLFPPSLSFYSCASRKKHARSLGQKKANLRPGLYMGHAAICAYSASRCPAEIVPSLMHSTLALGFH